jgi:hypothetical protein
MAHCVDCAWHLCDEHALAHSQIRSCRNHEIVPRSQISRLPFVSRFCSEHKSEQCTLYAEDCDRAVCVACVLEHKSDKFSSLEQAAANARRDMAERIVVAKACVQEIHTALLSLEQDIGNHEVVLAKHVPLLTR